MSTTWDTPAVALIEHVADGWEGRWSLLYAASHATVKLSLSVPLTTSVDLTFATTLDGPAFISGTQRWPGAVSVGDCMR